MTPPTRCVGRAVGWSEKPRQHRRDGACSIRLRQQRQKKVRFIKMLGEFVPISSAWVMPPLASKGGHALASGFLILRNTQTHDLAGGWEPPLRWLGGNLPAKHQFAALLSKCPCWVQRHQKWKFSKMFEFYHCFWDFHSKADKYIKENLADRIRGE